MIEYPKIESLYKRDINFKFVETEWRLPEFQYLQDNLWRFEEKLDGTGVRVVWDGEKVRFGGRTERAQMPIFLLDKLTDMFPVEEFGDFDPMCLYGEGIGSQIQKGGGNYIPDGVSFVLFDVMIDGWWLRKLDVLDVAGKLAITTVPPVGFGTLSDACDIVKNGLQSAYGDFEAEGLVMRPMIDLKTRAGNRVIAKVKGNDFAK